MSLSLSLTSLFTTGAERLKFITISWGAEQSGSYLSERNQADNYEEQSSYFHQLPLSSVSFRCLSVALL